MNTELEHQLRELGASQHLPRSAAQVMGRGDQIRRRRGRRLGLGATAAAIAGVSAMGGLGALGDQGRPAAGPGPEREVAFALVNLTQPALDSATAQCAALEPKISDAGAPVAAVKTGDLSVVTYHLGSEGYTCEITKGSETALSSWPWDPAQVGDEGAQFVTYGFMTTEMIAEDDVPDPAGPHMTGFGFVAPGALSVKARIGGQMVPAALEDGMFALWSSESFTTEDFDNATLVTTQADGTEIVTEFP
jgi:hypothetical protein